MTEVAARLPGLVKLAGLSAQVHYAYRVNLLLQLVGILVQIYLLKVVWTTVYAGRAEVDGVALPVLISYLTLANLQLWLLETEVGRVIHEKVREGTIALDLARPVGLIGQLVWRQIGLTAALVPFLAVALPAALVVGGLQLPASPEAGALYAVSLALGYGVSVVIAILLGLVVFWTFESHGVFAIYQFVNRFFAGALVPLWFFPDQLRSVAELLPFQTQAYLPLSIYVGRATGTDALRGIAVQAFWILALYLLTAALWRKAMRRVVVQGG